MDSLATAVSELLREILPAAVGGGRTLREQGLDSMAATRLWLELRARFGVELPLEWLAIEASPEGLVVRVEEAGGAQGGARNGAGNGVTNGVGAAAVARPAAVERDRPFPLTPMQESYVLGAQAELTDDPVGCDQYVELEVRGLDVERLRWAWQRVVARHDMLRSGVTADGMQRVRAEVPPVEIAVHDLRGLALGDAARAIVAVRRELVARRDADAERPVFEIEVSLRDSVAIVHLAIDMLVTDGHGLAVLLEDWRACYDEAGEAERGLPERGLPERGLPERGLSEPGISARDCVLALRGRSATDTYRDDLQWWADALRGMPPGPRVVDAEGGRGGFSRRTLEGALAPSEWGALRERAEALQVSPSALVLALFARTLGARGGEDACSLVVTTNLRPALPAEAERLVGPFTSAAIVAARELRGRLDDCARGVQAQLWEALTHSTVSAVEALRYVRSRERAPVAPAVVFTSLVGVGPGGRQDGGFGADVRFGVCRTSGVALELQIWEQRGELRYRWDAVPGRFAIGALETMFAAFENGLRICGLGAGAEAVAERPLNELQQAYYVARASAPSAAWNGCQIYESFEAAELDVGALEHSLGELARRHEALRTIVTVDGRLEVRASAPERWRIPVIELAGADELAAIRDEMTGRAFPLGVWPPFEVRVTRSGEMWTVHCAFELAALDARSIHVLCRELFSSDPAAVRARARAGSDEAPELAVRAAQAVGDGESYWDARLATLPAGPKLLAGDDRTRIRLQSRLVGWARLAQLAERHRVSPDALLLAAFLDVIAERLCDRAFAVPVVRFPSAEERNRPGEHTALSWVECVAGTSLLERAAEYQRVLDGDAAAGRTSGLRALRRRILRERGHREFAFPVVYTSIIDLTEVPLPPAIVQGEWMSCTPDVSLDCIGVREGDELFVCWDAVEADFAPGQLAAMFDAYRASLERLADDSQEEEREGEREQILYRWNDTTTPFPTERLIHQAFEERAAERPDAIALRGRGWTRSYGELDREANRIAAHLTARGVGPEVIVGIAIRRGPEMIAAVLGILKAGGAYLPVEPSLPGERAAVLLTEARARILLTTATSRSWDPPRGTEVVLVEREAAGSPASNASVGLRVRATACADNLAYVIFTSGSTGTPKGVAVAHRSVVNLLQWCGRTFPLGPADIGLCVTSLGFDLSVFDIFGILGSGGTLYIADEVERADPQLLLELLVEQRITFWNSAPAALSLLAPLLPAARGRAGTDSLRLVFLSGDYTPLSLPDDVRATFPEARIVNLGGATEATVWSNVFPVGAIDPSWRSIPYGRPIDNARYHVLDAQLEPCPVGIEGDLYIGGECLSLGYVGRPELTADRFVPDPHSRVPGQRLYRTGDRAAYLPDGNLCFLGRADRQLKIRGFRVELEEIEHRLRGHAAVKDAVVVARPAPTGDTRLVAYVMARPGARIDAAELRAFAAQALPDYMVPNFVDAVASFPMTANGKLDRDRLPWPLPLPEPEPEPERLLASDAPRAAGPSAAQLEQEIAVIFAELLGLPRFDPAQDIWNQGATSFTVVQASNALRARYGRRIPVAAVVADPTAAGIARWLAAELGGSGAEVAPPPVVDEPGSAGRGSAAEWQRGVVDYFSEDDRRRFKAGEHHLRPRSPGEPVIALPPPRVDPAYYRWRSSRRDLAPGQVPHDSMCRLLGLLAQATVDGRARRLYPSAGDTYAVQVYLLVREGGIAGVEPGLYYYRPGEHALQLVRARAELDRAIHGHDDRALFDRAAFELFLIGQTHGIAPLYREHAERYLALEAGHIAQLLQMGQAACGLGLCAIGDLAFPRVREQLGLDDGHRFLLALLGGRAEWLAAPSRMAPPFADRSLEDVAIIGMAGRFPGAEDPHALWEQLVAKRSAIGMPPAARRGAEGAEAADAVHAAREAGYLARIDEFDSLLFRISPAEAETLDPQLRLLLEAVWACLDDAGHSAESLKRTAGRVGVVVGAMWQDYQQVGAEAWQSGGEPVVSAVASDIAHRISQCFDFQGPSFAVDAACTSSLAALHLAVEMLRRGECGAVVVGAVNLLAHPYHAGLLAGLGLSAERIAGAFDAGESGWVPGEGVAAVLLRLAPAAIAEGDVIHGVVEATALGHAGRKGAADPSGLASSLAWMLTERGLAPGAISYVECAAAGASVGDAAELEALAALFGGERERVPVGTLKANIGHLEAAAGLSQLIKVLLQMRHRQLAPTRIAAQRNPLVAWDDVRLRIVDEVAPWGAGDAPVRALVNAVGANGAYGHLVVRSAPPRPREATGGPSLEREHVVVLSAATEPQLAAMARRLRDQLAVEPALLADLAYTLQTGRAELSHRIAIPCADLPGLLRRLDAFAEGRASGAAVTGQAAAWMRGEPVGWTRERPARRVSLPAYPFARRAHWVRVASRGLRASAGSSESRLLQIFAEVSGIAREDLNAHAALEQYGLSSLLVTRLNARLAREYAGLPKTLFYEHSTIAEIAARLSRCEAVGPAESAVESAATSRPSGDIAIIGLAGRYPQARDLAQLWTNLAAGRDCITELPIERRRPGWPVDRMWGGYLDGVDQFDAAFFHITPHEADLTDPQERLFLETVWEALDDAGYPRQRLRERHGSRAGVWVGSMYNEYPLFGVERSLAGPPVSAGAGLADIANRVSYFFDLRGPSMAVDTLCSSSLTSLHLAVESLRRGECEVAIAGGVNLSLHPNKHIEQARHGMPSTDHRCRSFGAGGDGFVPGEGVCAVILKRLHAAIADCDRIHAVIKATAVNHGGRTNGYMVPSPAAQADVVGAALRSAGIAASTIGYLEAHGTGTELGDPIELAGLDRAFEGEAPPPGGWPIGSVKSAIGHLEGAAGIASLTKVVLQLRARELAPSLHAEELNPNIDWARSRFRVQRERAAWPAVRDADGRCLPRRAGISSFGAGGSNAHVIVEEHIEPIDHIEPARSRAGAGAGAPAPQLIVLSALDEERLRAVARSLASAIGARAIGAGDVAIDFAIDVAIEDVAYTLQVGREHLRERLALVVADLAELRAALDRFCAGDERGAIRGRATPGRGDATSTDPADLVALGRAWVEGRAVAWSPLHARRRPRIVELPSYPFARRRHWVPWAEALATPRAIDVPLYRKVWSLDAGDREERFDGRVVCLFHDGSKAVARELARRLGARAILLREGSDVREVPEAGAGLAGWIDLCDLGRPDGDPGPWLARLAMLQRWLVAHRGTEVRVLHVTSGLQDQGGARPSLAGAHVAGLVRMLRAEQRQVRATALDVDAEEAGAAEAARAIAEELARGDATEVCYRAGLRYVPELAAVALTEAELRLDPSKLYLVTGGTRGLGALVARRLVERGARRLALMGARRSEAGAGGEDPAAPLVRELEVAGATVLLHRGQLTARAEVAAFVARARAAGELGGVVHCAGLLPEDRRPFAQRPLGAWDAAFGPKVDGLEVLAEVCERDRPAFFVLFSSVAGAFPALAAGAAEYAAANAFLDEFAAHQARTGKPWFRSVAWPSWRGAGAAAPEPPAYARLGLDGIGIDDGLRLFEAVAASASGGALIVAPGRGAEARPSELLDVLEVAREAQAPAPAPAPDRTAAGAVPPWLTALFADSLGMSPTALAPDVPFGDLGIESILLTELLEKLERHLGRSLDPTILLDHPTLASLAAALPAPATPDPAPPTPALAPERTPRPARISAPSAPSARSTDTRIAVIGAACRFPGAPDLATFWANLRDGRCAVGEVPPSRWRTELLYRPQLELGKSISKWGGFLDDVEAFDPAYFRMTDEEAICLDPAVRLVLEGVETCLADAGYAPRELAGRDVGVFAGARASDYWRRVGARTGSAPFGSDQNFIAARVAQHLDLGGPCFVVDSACSSSLVAVQLAARSLVDGESDLAFAAGVDVLLDERPYVEFSAARALSPSGRCRVFDERADGFVPGEGCGVVLLKRLDLALRDGDRIRAVLEAIAVNNDGRTVGLTTPNPAAQTKVIRRALAQSGLAVEDLALIEAHGTGTMLGDPMELRALTDAFAEQTGRVGSGAVGSGAVGSGAVGSCAVGSVKSNLGHLLSAAGIAGLIKVVLALEHGELPPTLFCERPNPRFDFGRSPFYPNVALRPWPADRMLRAAGVSAFGLGGTNAHAIATALEPSVRAGAAVIRRPLPAPRFVRRRLWIDRDEPAVPVPPPPPDAPRELVASILDFDFIGNALSVMRKREGRDE